MSSFSPCIASSTLFVVPEKFKKTFKFLESLKNVGQILLCQIMSIFLADISRIVFSQSHRHLQQSSLYQNCCVHFCQIYPLRLHVPWQFLHHFLQNTLLHHFLHNTLLHHFLQNCLLHHSLQNCLLLLLSNCLC